MAAALVSLLPASAPGWAGHIGGGARRISGLSDPAPIRIPGQLQMGAVMQHRRAYLPADTIFCKWRHHFATWRNGSVFTSYSQPAPTSGSMGWPAGRCGRQALKWPAREVNGVRRRQ